MKVLCLISTTLILSNFVKCWASSAKMFLALVEEQRWGDLQVVWRRFMASNMLLKKSTDWVAKLQRSKCVCQCARQQRELPLIRGQQMMQEGWLLLFAFWLQGWILKVRLVRWYFIRMHSARRLSTLWRTRGLSLPQNRKSPIKLSFLTTSINIGAAGT